MSLFLRAILEMLRILVLFGIYSRAASYFVMFIKKKMNVSFAFWADALLFLLFFVIFTYWYRKKGQYNGWYPVEKN